jgi:hypothetical protein
MNDNALAQRRRERYAYDLEVIDRNADRLNAEAHDVLTYQECPGGDEDADGNVETPSR